MPSTWIVYRRYRDFYEFQVVARTAEAAPCFVLIDIYVYLQSVVKRYGFVVPSQFPGKKAFGRFGDEFLATRHRMLNSWLRGLIECKVVLF